MKDTLKMIYEEFKREGWFYQDRELHDRIKELRRYYEKITFFIPCSVPFDFLVLLSIVYNDYDYNSDFIKYFVSSYGLATHPVYHDEYFKTLEEFKLIEMDGGKIKSVFDKIIIPQDIALSKEKLPALTKSTTAEIACIYASLLEGFEDEDDEENIEEENIDYNEAAGIK